VAIEEPLRDIISIKISAYEMTKCASANSQCALVNHCSVEAAGSPVATVAVAADANPVFSQTVGV
jgi:hypothetical protein